MLSLREYISHPKITAIVLLEHFGQWLPDSVYVRIMYRLRIGRRLHLRNPKTFNEKLQWLKLYNRRPEYTMMVDKYAVKDYVAGLIGKEYVIPTLGVWERPEDIDFGSLPNQFVLKTTHGGGSTGVIICKDKTSFNRADAIEKLKRSMKQDIYKYQKEWPYKNVYRRIIAEEFIAPSNHTNDLNDYKFYCFGGKPEFMLLISEREIGGDAKCDYYDMDFQHLPFSWAYPHSETPITTPPPNFEKMKELAAIISKTLPHARIDLYNVNGHIYFGEITLYHGGGFCKFEPWEWDYKFGELIELPKEKSLNK